MAQTATFKRPPKSRKPKEIVEYRHLVKSGFPGSFRDMVKELRGRIREAGQASSITLITGDLGLLLDALDNAQAARAEAETVVFSLAPSTAVMLECEGVPGDRIVNLTTTMSRVRRCLYAAEMLRTIPADVDHPETRQITAPPSGGDHEEPVTAPSQARIGTTSSPPSNGKG